MDFLVLVGLLTTHKRPQILLKQPLEYIDYRRLGRQECHKTFFELFVADLEALVVHLVDAFE